MQTHTTDAEIISALRAMRDADGVKRTAAKALGVHPEIIAKRLRFAKERGLTADTPVRDPVEKLREENRRLKSEIKTIHKHNDTAEELRKTIYNLQEVPADPPDWLFEDVAIEGPGTPMTMWSDWHFGEVVKKQEVGGLNEFNSDIAEARVQRLVDRTTGLIRHHMPDGVPGMVVMLGGDMMTGDIHMELQDTNDKYVLETVRQLKSVLVGALTHMADVCGNIFVPCVVGNHGRNTLKPRMKGVVHTSYEWNIYCDLEDRMRADERIKFFIPTETDALFSVHGHRFLLTHGDRMGVKGGDGIIGALGPIKRGEFKVRNSESQIGRDFDTIVMGHWHQAIATRGLIVNNCLKGYDEFARLALRAPATPASQQFWFLHPKWGINAQMEVYVQDVEPFQRRQKKRKKSPWVEVFDKAIA